MSGWQLPAQNICIFKWQNDGGNRNRAKSHFAVLPNWVFFGLITTAAAMDGKPLNMREAWHVYDRFYADDLIIFLMESAEAEPIFRKQASRKTASPKIWAMPGSWPWPKPREA